jgi:hypothetical protein
MPISTITLTSASTTTSSPVNLNWMRAAPTTVFLSMPSTTGSLDATVQVTGDDISRTPSSLASWFNLGSSGIATHYSSANLDVGGKGPIITIAGPVAGVRLQSTNISSGPLMANVLQAEG